MTFQNKTSSESDNTTLDSVKIHKASWFNEESFYYMHSYMVLETELSSYESLNREKLGIPEHQTKKYYVTEKNSLGVIWNMFYTLNEATWLKTEHDGSVSNREA